MDYGVYINKENKFPLHTACKNRYIKVVKYLIDVESNINKEDEQDETSLFITCIKGQRNIVQYLVDIGASIDKQNKGKLRY